MRGLMMDRQLLISSLVEYAAQVYRDTEIVSRTVEGPIHRYTWTELRQRAKQLAGAMKANGTRDGDRIATIAWNGYRHLELYYGISGMGAVLHTVNPRLHPSQLVYILNHAQDRVVFLDLTFVPLIEAVADKLESVRAIVVMTDREHMPRSDLDLLCYEELIAEHDGDFEWPSFDENTAAAICYTSGTTGHPKGVVFSHRSTILHAYGESMPSTLPAAEGDAVLPVVPMFHVNAWGFPYCVAMTGAKLVFPGPRMDGEALTQLMNDEGVTLYSGVPTVHMGLLAHWDETGATVPSLNAITTGGAAPTRTMLEAFRSRGVEVIHGWGMTETSPVGTISRVTAKSAGLDDDEQIELIMKQGRPLFGVELRIVDEKGQPLPRDGVASGELQIRGPWVCSAYFGEEPGSRLDADGWFPTGDVAVIHPDGTIRLTDRKKDLIKSGGEWISSIDLEDMAMRHPEIAQAAVIGIPHEKWGERPLLVAVKKPDAEPTKESILEFLEGQVAKWWLPDDVVFVDELPLGATGKVQKTKLREEYGQEASAAGS
jgi:3-(methylthio)propionyl---CoA ligase